jgi:hypothetical protein
MGETACAFVEEFSPYDFFNRVQTCGRYVALVVGFGAGSLRKCNGRTSGV